MRLWILAAGLICFGKAQAAPVAADHVQAEPVTVAKATELLAASVGFRTVMGQRQVPAYAEYLADQLKTGGFAPADVQLQPLGETSSLVARYRGTGEKRPVLISAHMDVVAADPKDWTRDPFKMITEKGYVFGRGVLDNKFDVSMIVATLLQLKSEGFQPNRDLVLVLSGDEETAMLTTRALSTQFPDAELVLNGDGGGGTLADDGHAVAYNLQAAEKTYASYTLTTTNPGGHSSRPRDDNAIYELSAALGRLAAFQFPAQSSELTRAYFSATGRQTEGLLGKAMQRFAADTADAEAIAIIAADPEYVGNVRTTCVATQLAGGHAENALPQRAVATVNCRIFPGVSIADVRDTLARVVDDPDVVVATLGAPVASDASPLRDDVMRAVRAAIDQRYPGLPIIPQMSSGATDSLHFRAAGIPSYGVSGIFMKPSDDFAHGLDERVPVAEIAGDLVHWHVLLTELAR